jgi:uncharacterized membrane protein
LGKALPLSSAKAFLLDLVVGIMQKLGWKVQQQPGQLFNLFSDEQESEDNSEMQSKGQIVAFRDGGTTIITIEVSL